MLPNLASAQDTGRIQKKEVGPDGQPTLIEFYGGNGQLTVSSLAAGLYLLRASDGQNTFVKRFSKIIE